MTVKTRSASAIDASSVPNFSDNDITANDIMRYLETVEELPMLSDVAVRINSMLQDMDTSADELAGVIEKDPAIVTKLLKMTNSSFFGFSAKVSNTAHAVMILGYNTVLNAVLSMAVIDAMGAGPGKRSGLNMKAFWRHAVSVAVVSRYLCRTLGGHRHENAFTAGIIHDIGKIVMAQFFTGRFMELTRCINEERISFRAAEKRLFSMGHDAMGAFLARRWNLPNDLSAAIAQHHHPDMMPDVNHLALVVHAADCVVNVYVEGRSPVEQWSLCEPAQSLFGETVRKLDEWLPAIKEEIQTACELMLES